MDRLGKGEEGGEGGDGQGGYRREGSADRNQEDLAEEAIY
jgi:hypothetical protein